MIREAGVDNLALEPHTAALAHPVTEGDPFFYVERLHMRLLFHCSSTGNKAFGLKSSRVSKLCNDVK